MQPVEAVPICCVALTSRSDPEENNLFHGDERPGGYEEYTLFPNLHPSLLLPYSSQGQPSHCFYWLTKLLITGESGAGRIRERSRERQRE